MARLAIREAVLTKQPPLFPALDAELFKKLGFKGEPSSRQAKEIWDRCAQDPEFYIFGGFVRTSDEHDIKNPVKPFPDKEYLREILKFIRESASGDVCAISKSRQLLITWLLTAYATWEARFNSHRRVMIQSKKAEDAWKLTYRGSWFHSRCGFIERAMPHMLRSIGLKGTRGELAYPNGSEIWGIPQGAHMFRSYTASLVICDEACFQDAFEDAYTAALPMAKGGGKIILCSTAAAGTYYAHVVEEEEMEGTAA